MYGLQLCAISACFISASKLTVVQKEISHRMKVLGFGFVGTGRMCLRLSLVLCVTEEEKKILKDKKKKNNCNDLCSLFGLILFLHLPQCKEPEWIMVFFFKSYF